MTVKRRVVIAAILLLFTSSDGKALKSGGDAPRSLCFTGMKEKVVTLTEAHLNSSGPTSVQVHAGQSLNITMQRLPGQAVCNWSFGASQISEGYSLTIPWTSERDSGQYTLSCARNYSSNSSLTLILLVGSPLRSPSRPQLNLVNGGEGYVPVFRCSSEGNPQPIIKWYNNLDRTGVVSYGDGMLNSDGPGRVKSSRSSKHYVGTTVMCCAENSVGVECSHLYDYDLDTGVQGAEEAPEIFVSPGQTLLLRCKTKQQHPKPEWQNVTQTQVTTAVNYLGKRMSYLSIQPLTARHSGVYTCRSGKDIKSTRIQVLEKGFISVDHLSESVTISAHKKAEFCLRLAVFSHPPLRCCYWLGPNNSLTRCPEPTRSWKNRSLELCNPVGGMYKLHLENEEQNLTKNISLCVTDRPTLNLIEFGGHITCMTDTPLPFSLTWWSCTQSSPSNCSDWKELSSNPPEVNDSDMFCHKKVRSSRHMDVDGDVLVKCCIKNSAYSECSGPLHRGASLAVFRPPDHSLSGSSSGLLLALVLVSMAFVFVCVRKKKPQYQSQLQMIQMTGPNDNDYIYINFKDFSYDQKWEFPRENLELGRELGSGAFGMVVQATAYGISKPGFSQQVAVKMLKEKHETVEKEALMSELKMLTHIGQHANIVNLLGACTNSGPTYLIFQYCSKGDLLNYLKNNRGLYQKSLTEAAARYRFNCLYRRLPRRSNSELLEPVDHEYVPMSPSTSMGPESIGLLSLNSSCVDAFDSQSQGMSEDQKEQNEEEESEHLALTYNDLLSFSYQVANGMEFLSSMQCIHRDLAARNVLVTQGGLVKIGDFGLARDIDNDSNYVVKGNVRLPVKWMAPESIFQGIYTMQSDVWAYGILLWEIFSLGVTPYPGIKVDKDFYMKIERGYKMEQPYYASEPLYKMMCECWAMRPGDRPAFPNLVAFMDKELTYMEEKLYCNILDKSSNNSLYQNAPMDSDLSALAELKCLQKQNQYSETRSTREASGTTEPSDTAAMETDGDERPLKPCQ
ncbi:receptor-type tyrosine-protein kinase FLT3 isoform X2 [Esox lucius]|uniref:receptor protein-tyrosine kinase n=1 Tax=Esox lucius TaxID=8010 RepID=A0A3P9A3X0_ESOLU|nr:receptor-type tyrosine-protein kinase FLT3 isoform X2 [Esox lucius]